MSVTDWVSRLPVRWRYDHAIGKAKGWIGYAPRGDLGTMMRDAWDVKRRIGDAGAIRGIMRASHPDLNSAAEVAAAVSGLHRAGIDDIAFYNYGHWRLPALERVREALAAFGDR